MSVTAASSSSRCYPSEFILKWAIPVLDEKSVKSLEWRQLQNHPRLKYVWKQSYTNEFGRLCQGVGRVKDIPNKQRVEGSDTFFVIKRKNIPVKRRKKISFIKVVCEVRPKNQTPI